MVFNGSWVEEDMKKGQQKQTTAVMMNALNSICDYLKFTTEDCLDFDDHKLPKLDCKLWTCEYRI